MKRLLLAILMASTLALTACGGGAGYGGYYNDNDRIYSQNYEQYQRDCLTASGKLRAKATYACRNNTNTTTNQYTPAKPTVRSGKTDRTHNKPAKTYKTNQQKSSPFKSNSGYKPGRTSSFKSR